MPPALDLPDHAYGDRIIDPAAVEREPVHAVPGDHIEALGRLDQLAREHGPALLAVGDHVDTGPLLDRDAGADGIILDAFERLVREAAGGMVVAGLEEIR
jgi:hypothetical protein